MIYLILGEDNLAKEEKITELKAKCLKSDDAVKFDFQSLHVPKCDPAELKKALIAIPAISKKRLILIRTVEKLDAQNKKLILDFLRSEDQQAVLILETSESVAKNKFFNTIASVAEVLSFGHQTSKQNVFDMTRAMEGRNSSEALKILDRLIQDGNHPLQIMGGLVWFWGKLKQRLTKDNFKKGLLVLQEADLNIKRSRLKPEYAVEIAVMKLGLLISG